MADTNNDQLIAREVFWRYHEIVGRGHIDYIQHARRLEDYYLGGGRQWRAKDREAIESQGRPAHEVNTILPTVNAAAGQQIANRVDITYEAKGGRATEQTAKVLSKVVKHSLENTRYRWRETQAFLDGLIQQRGYMDIRMDYSDSTLGEVKVIDLDPMDVIPDPDSKSYDPDGWADVNITRYMTEQEIEGTYGQNAAQEVRERATYYADQDDWGSEYVDRSGFADMPPSYARTRGWYLDDSKHRRYRIIDQQSHEYALSLVAIWPTGDVRVIENLPPAHIAWLIDRGVQITKRRMRRVRWRVCAPDVTIENKLSPYDHFTVVPYFPYFRRGRTVGMVDNMVSPTDMLNKFISQYAHIINGVANSGWQGEAGVLANMTDDEFTNRGAENGLVLLRKPNTQPFTKIQGNQVPTGVEKMISFAHDHLSIVSGVDPSVRDPEKADLSGIALQALEYASQQKLAIALDNLSQTRHMVADRVRGLVQRYMGQERVIRISEVDKYGVEKRVPLPLNVRMDDGTIFNDLTVGEYSVTVSEKPGAVTFDNTDFEQMKSMRAEMGIKIPDAAVVRASNLSEKGEIAEALAAQDGAPDMAVEAEAALKAAMARKADADAIAKNVEAQFSAIQTAQAIVVTPQAAALADALLRSAGYKDADAAPIVPEAPAGMAPPPGNDLIPQNTHPLTPANPDVGMTRGLSDSPTQP